MNNAYIRLMIYLYTSEKNSADYTIAKVLLSMYEQFPDILIEDIAKKANSTPATVTKFAHKLGYKSFKELRFDTQNLEVQQDINQQLLYASSDYEMACDTFYHKEQEKLSFYKNFHSLEIIHKIAECFYKSNSIGVVYPPYAYTCTHVLRNYLTPLHKQVEGVMREVDEQFMEERMQNCEVIILISLQASWVKQNAEVCNRWKQQHKKIILITAVYDEDFCGIPDIVVPFQFVGETIMDTAYQISTLLIKASFACVNFPKMEKIEL